jgi:predicted MFS family arabinose efflux permease
MKPRWQTLWIMFAIQVVGSLTFLTLTVLTPFVKGDFGVSTTEIGLLVTLLYAGYFSSVTTGGIVTDYAGERFALGVGLALIGSISFLLSVLPTFWTVATGAYVVGLGYGTVPSGTNKGIFDWFPADQRTIGISIKQTGVMLGGAAGAAFLPAIASVFGWRTAVRVVAATTILMLGTIYLYSPKTEPSGRRVPSATRVLDQHRRILRLAATRDVFPFLISGVLFGATQFTLMAYIVLYLTESLLFAPAIAGLVYTGMQLMGMGSRIGFGFLTDSYFAGSKHLVLAGIGIVGFVFYLPLLVLSPETEFSVALVVLLCVGAVSLGYNGVYLTMASEVMDGDEAGTGTAIGVAAIMIGAVVSPPIVGVVIDATGGYGVPLATLGFVTLLAGIAAFFGVEGGEKAA